MFGSQDRLEDDLLAAGSHGDPATDVRDSGYILGESPNDALRGARDYDAHHRIVNCRADDDGPQAAGVRPERTPQASGAARTAVHPNSERPLNLSPSSGDARDQLARHFVLRGRPYIEHGSLPRASLRCSDYPYFYRLKRALKLRAHAPLVLLITDCNRNRIRHGYRCLYRRAYGGHDCERKRFTV